jgi:hypothetical protein
MASFFLMWLIAFGPSPPLGGSKTQMTSVNAIRLNKLPRWSSALKNGKDIFQFLNSFIFTNQCLLQIFKKIISISSGTVLQWLNDTDYKLNYTLKTTFYLPGKYSQFVTLLRRAFWSAASTASPRMSSPTTWPHSPARLRPMDPMPQQTSNWKATEQTINFFQWILKLIYQLSIY